MLAHKTRSNGFSYLSFLSWAGFFAVLCMSYLYPVKDSINEKTDGYFLKQIAILKQQLIAFRAMADGKTSAGEMRLQFKDCRLAYKKLAVLSEYFNIYETKLLNGPALQRAEDDNPDVIIPPQGFQVIEEILFSDGIKNYREAIIPLLEKMLGTIGQMEKEPDRIHKFKEEAVWDALRSASIRLITLGITGYDSPVAQLSIPEAAASIVGMQGVLLLFQEQLQERYPGIIPSLQTLLNKAHDYLEKNPGFNEFNRLAFITTYINPFYTQLVMARATAGIAFPAGQSPVNFNAGSIFGEDFFNINFFSPDKEYWITDKRIALGKKLFSDPILSGTKDRNCASCHRPEKAFTDGLTVPLGLDKKTKLSRNTPTLWNSSLQTRQFLDARTDILENQLKEVVHSTSEMSGSLKESADDLKKMPAYQAFFTDAYKGEKEPINAFNIANAISSYVRSLISLRSRFDGYMTDNAPVNLSAAEKNGFNLFTGKAKCATCHFIPLFNGLVPPEFTETETEVLGIPAAKGKKNAVLDTDAGKYNLSHSVVHKFAFKTPTLRNIELTAPYMHNGVFSSLEEVMDFYNKGGGAGLNIAPENQTLPKDKLNLSKKEIAQIIAFMRSLTDPAVKDYK